MSFSCVFKCLCSRVIYCPWLGRKKDICAKSLPDAKLCISDDQWFMRMLYNKCQSDIVYIQFFFINICICIYNFFYSKCDLYGPTEKINRQVYKSSMPTINIVEMQERVFHLFFNLYFEYSVTGLPINDRNVKLKICNDIYYTARE